MFKPDIISLDYETLDENGGSLEYWKNTFRVDSCALSWFNKRGTISNHFIQGEERVRGQLKVIQDQGIPLLAHNAQFEVGVTKCRFPEIDIGIFTVDTMRLVQNYDSGGQYSVTTPDRMSLEDEAAYLDGTLNIRIGLGLTSSASRILDKVWHEHKAVFYKWLRENAGVRKGEEGANLNKLPLDMLKAYNVADTDTALMLYKTITGKFKDDNFDWTFDHKLHINAIDRITGFKIRGYKINRPALEDSIISTYSEIKTIRTEFLDHHKDIIESIERDRTALFIDSVKTPLSKFKRWQAVCDKTETAVGAIEFNPNSTTQLKELFVDRLGLPVKFYTKESKESKKKRDKDPTRKPFNPSPSFRAAHLTSYGPGGAILENSKKRQIVHKQSSNLLLLSGIDGRWHMDIRACGAKTGRYNGGGGGDIRLNPLGLSRGEKGMMSTILPAEGYDLGSVDLSSGEPTVVAHYSGDKNYRLANFEMVGKAPYWDETGILQLDDMYLQGASVSPMGSKTMQELTNTTWNGNTFAEQWLADSDLVKVEVKKLRKFHKVLILGLMYGLGAKGMVDQAYDNGHELELKDAKLFHFKFWNELYPGVKLLGDKLKFIYGQKGYIVNEFGFRMTPEADRLCLNYAIQSSVSGIMKVLEDIFYKKVPNVIPNCVIHDELIFEFPKDAEVAARQAMDDSVKELNTYLGWTVDIRTGWVKGSNLYEAK